MKVKCQMCSSNFVDEKDIKKKKNHGHIILLGLIKYPHNFKLKISLITCWTQIKSQILTKMIDQAIILVQRASLDEDRMP